MSCKLVPHESEVLSLYREGLSTEKIAAHYGAARQSVDEFLQLRITAEDECIRVLNKRKARLARLKAKS